MTADICEVLHKYLKDFPWLRGDVPAPSLASFPEMSGIGESSMGDMMFSWKNQDKISPFTVNVQCFFMRVKLECFRYHVSLKTTMRNLLDYWIPSLTSTRAWSRRCVRGPKGQPSSGDSCWDSDFFSSESTSTWTWK